MSKGVKTVFGWGTRPKVSPPFISLTRHSSLVPQLCRLPPSCAHLRSVVVGAIKFSTHVAIRNILASLRTCYDRTSFIRRYVGLHHFFFFFPYPEARVRYDLVSHSCTIRSGVLVGYDMISRLVSVRYQSQSHIYYDT